TQPKNQDLDNKTIVVQVLTSDKLKINNEDATWAGLGTRIDQIFKDRAEKIAFVKGDNDVLFAQVARAIDIMRANGIDKVGLITAKLEAGQEFITASIFLAPLFRISQGRESPLAGQRCTAR